MPGIPKRITVGEPQIVFYYCETPTSIPTAKKLGVGAGIAFHHICLLCMI